MLEIHSIVAGYGKAEVLQDLSLHVGRGEVVALLGPNGCGKTTTMRVIAGLIKARSGEVRLNNRNITTMSARERVLGGLTLVPAGRSLFFSMTVDENLMMGAFTRRGADVAADKQHWLRVFPPLAHAQHRNAGELSGGQQRMGSFARGLMSRPSVVLLDEPSLGVAPLVLKDIGGAIRTMRDEEQIGCLLVEQDIPFALSVADRVLVLTQGRIVLEETDVDSLRDGLRLRDAFFNI